MNLRDMLLNTRIRIKDLGMRRWQEIELRAAINEGKNELAKLIRQSRRDYFISESTGTIGIATAPNPSLITCPVDFIELKEIEVTTSGFTFLEFIHMDSSDPQFRRMLRIGGSFGSGSGFFFYDVRGVSQILLAPGTDIALDYKMAYVQTIPDLTLPTDEPTLIPSEHHDFIVTYAVCECLREMRDEQLPDYLDKLQRQREMIAESVADNQIKEPVFVRSFMEGEW